MRQGKKALIMAILSGNSGSLDAFLDLLELELEDAFADLEQADDNISIWRAQGRAQELRSLLEALNMRGRWIE